MEHKRKLVLLFAIWCAVVLSMPNAMAANVVSQVEVMDAWHPPPTALCSDNIQGKTIWPNDWDGSNTQDLRQSYNPGDTLWVKIDCTATNNDPSQAVYFSFGLSLYTRHGWTGRLNAYTWDTWTPSFQQGETGVKMHTLVVGVVHASDVSALWIADYTCGCTPSQGGFVNADQNYWIQLIDDGDPPPEEP